MTIMKTHTGTVITKDGPKVKKLHQTERMWVVGKNEFYHKETGLLDVNYLGRYASTTLAAFELFLS
ncbi:hypothetical protein [Klebsiella pneumoniae]|uniref:hypothetical protein n=1 Tax=Klebsiella pneumoniae TaxID=573 RepID=UPI000E2CA0C5|nr:hypothetical protein [Klebsiella pneumoniae]SYU94077.1 Uncharacterised protein [Klebsiella pneumoniae]